MKPENFKAGGGGQGLALIFILAGGGGGGSPLDPLPPSPGPPPPLPPQLKCTRKPGFWEHFLVKGKFFSAPSAHAMHCVHIAPWCSIYLVFQTAMPQRSLSMYFSSPVPPLPRAKRENVIDALLYFRFKDRITGHKRKKAEVPSDPESVDDEVLADNLSDVSQSGSDSDSSSSSGSSSSSTTDGGSSSGESDSD